jgi:hypothetical protein
VRGEAVEDIGAIADVGVVRVREDAVRVGLRAVVTVKADELAHAAGFPHLRDAAQVAPRRQPRVLEGQAAADVVRREMIQVQMKDNRKIVEIALVAAGFTVLAVVMTLPLLIHATRALPGDLGDPLLNAWILGWDAQHLAHGLIGLWDAPILYPARHTLAYSEHLLGIAVFVAPIYWASANAVLAYNVAFIGSYVLAGTGMYLLARDLCGRRDAAVLASLVFAFGPYRAGHVSHLQVLFSGWMPIALWRLHRYFAAPSWRRLVAFAAAYVLQALSNGYYLFFLALPVAIISGYELFRRRREWKPLAVQLGTAAMLIGAAIAPFALAYMELRRQGLHRLPSDWTMFSADVGSYLLTAERVRFWRWLHGAVNVEAQLFPGLTVLALAAIALLTPSPESRTPGGEARTPSPESPRESQIPNPESRISSPESRIPNPESRLRLYSAIAASAFVLSLGPEPKAWGQQILPSGPYLWLVRIVPGLDGLRAPARLSIVVHLALAVLAAFGAARLLSVLSERTRGLAFFAIALFALVEGAALPLQLAAVDGRGRPQDRAVYRWLSASEAGTVLELPIREWDISPTLIYQYATLFHGHPIANGYSGYGSSLQEFLGGSGSPLRELAYMDGTLAMLRAIGVRYVLVHPGDYDDPAFGAASVRAIKESSGHVAETRDYGAVVAFRLLPAAADSVIAAGGLQRIAATHVTATASHRPDRLPLAFDGNLDTRWTSLDRQTGDEWIAIAFDRAYDLARISLRLNRWSLGDYPRELSIETTSGAISKEVYRGDVLTPLGLALFRTGSPSIDIDIPPTPTTAVRLRQRGQTRLWFWSINEIELWRR